MVKINKRLLPIKAHYLFFMAAMGPILPQLSVFGKQMGISPEVMGYITSVLPIFYVLAKPLFGFIADYFTHFRKLVFMLLILAMTLSYSGFYFVPADETHQINLADTRNVTIKDVQTIQQCDAEFTLQKALCSTTRIALCSIDTNNDNQYLAYVTATNVTQNTSEPEKYAICLPATHSTLNLSSSVSCHFSADLQPDCLYGTSTFWLFVIFMCVGTVGFNVVNSISDAICFDMLGAAEESKYGAQRVWGTIGFGASAFVAGFIVDIWTKNDIKSFTPAIFVMLIFSGLDLLSVSKLKLPKLSSSESIWKDVCSLITQPAIATFLIFAVIAGILDSFIIYFMFWHMEEVAAQTGFMHQIKLIEGCVIAAECLAGEVPFFFYSGKILKKLGYVHTMSLCFFFYAVRLALIGWIPNPWYLVAVELFFQGCTYALCYTCIVAYASAVAPPGTSATVQGLMAGMDDGLGFSIGSLIGGLAFKEFGGRSSFYYFAILAICTCIAHILIRPSSRKKQYLPKSGYQVPTEQVILATENKIFENGGDDVEVAKTAGKA